MICKYKSKFIISNYFYFFLVDFIQKDRIR